ncbi:MAG: cytochrome c biogenesis protein CcsA [Deltaproteobacteria bacterium]|nr:cytochrome c biogenesis protein CcsA [Deltaproteobacteria bacterium]
MKSDKAIGKFGPGPLLAILATAAVLIALYAVFFIAPVEATMGIVQKIFYFHVGCAINMMVFFSLCGICGLIYLIMGGSRGRVASFVDALGVATAEVGVTLGAVVLVTGPIWARKAWGTWWTWEPRLTLALLVFLLFLAYLALRAFTGSERFGRSVAAGLAVVGLPALYFIHFAVQRWGGAHPQVVYKGGLTVPGMKLAFFLSVLAVMLVSATLALIRTQQELQARLVDDMFLKLDAEEWK